MVLDHTHVILRCNFNYTGYIHITLVPRSTPFTLFRFNVPCQYAILNLRPSAGYPLRRSTLPISLHLMGISLRFTPKYYATQWVTGTFLRVKRPVSEPDPSPPSNYEVKNMWIYTSIPLTYLHNVDREDCIYLYNGQPIRDSN